MFRELPQKAIRASEAKDTEYFGEEAVKAIDELMTSKPPKEAQLIFEETEKEQTRGWLSQTYT